MTIERSAPEVNPKEKLPPSAHAMCGWPLALVAVGGAIGGGLGGVAYGVNLAIYKSRLPVPVKVLLNVLTGLAAVALWLVAVAMIKRP